MQATSHSIGTARKLRTTHLAIAGEGKPAPVVVPTPQKTADLSDEELIKLARTAPAADSAKILDTLYERYYPRVTSWCLRYCGDRQRAADLVQETFLRLHTRLDTFRMESRFSTWLYQVTRSVAINRGLARNRRRSKLADLDECPEALDPTPPADETLHQQRLAAQTRWMLASHLTELEGKILYLHYVDGMTLPAISDLLALENKSGAKAFIVSAKRKLKRARIVRSDPHLAEVMAIS